MSVLRAGIETLQTHTFNAKCVLRGTTLPVLVLQAAPARTDVPKLKGSGNLHRLPAGRTTNGTDKDMCRKCVREDTKMSKAQVKVAKTVQQDLATFSRHAESTPQVTLNLSGGYYDE